MNTLTNNMLTILRAAADHFLKEPNATPHNEHSYTARDMKIVYILYNALHVDMLFYVESKLYPGRTMVLVCSRGDTVARAKALILHILSDISHRVDHFFRLKYHGEFLKDALSLQDYSINDMSVVKMVPLTHHNVMADSINQPVDQPDNEISTALSNEKLKFSQRSLLLQLLQVLVWLQLLSVIGNFVTVFWWAGLLVGLLTLTAKYLMPIYLHVGGSVGRMSKGDRRFMLVYSFLLMLVAIGDLTLFMISVIRILIPQCDVNSEYYNEYASRHCSYRVWFAAILLPVQLLMAMTTAIVCILLYYNFKFEAGQLVEACLVQTRDVSKVLHSVVHGNARQRNNAAFELVNLSVTDDNNKFRIVEEGGLQVMLSLLTSGETNEGTKDYAAEVLAELLTLETIQEQFIELGGLQTLCALLRSSRERVVYEVSCALSFITSSHDQHKCKVVDNNGLDDLFYPIEHACTVEVAELLSGILLDLCLHTGSRVVIADHHKTVTVMTSLIAMGKELCQSVLQSVELLIIDNDKLLDPILLDQIITITSRGLLDKQCALLASKILGCCANNEERVGLLASHDHLMEAMMSLIEIDESDVIETVVTIVTQLSQYQHLRSQLDERGLLHLKSKLNTAIQRYR